MKYDLYHFQNGDEHWYFCNARKNITWQGVTYVGIRGLNRGSITDKNIDNCETDITFPQPYVLLNENEQSLSAIFVNKIYYQGVRVEIFELEDDVSLILFRGRVLNPEFDEDSDTMTLKCSTSESLLKRTVFTRKFQKTCPNSIYDMFCGLNIEDWAFEARITSISGQSFTFEVLPTQAKNELGELVFDEFDEPTMEVKTYPSDYLNNGLLIKGSVHTWLRDGGLMYRPHWGLKVNDVVLLAPGCDQTRKMCHEKFDNHKRCGAQINIPNETPTATQIIK